MENERIRILLERQKEQILAEVRNEIQKHEFQAEQLPEQNRDLREADIKSLHEMEELKRVQELRINES